MEPFCEGAQLKACQHSLRVQRRYDCSDDTLKGLSPCMLIPARSLVEADGKALLHPLGALSLQEAQAGVSFRVFLRLTGTWALGH